MTTFEWIFAMAILFFVLGMALIWNFSLLFLVIAAFCGVVSWTLVSLLSFSFFLFLSFFLSFFHTLLLFVISSPLSLSPSLPLSLSPSLPLSLSPSLPLSLPPSLSQVGAFFLCTAFLAYHPLPGNDSEMKRWMCRSKITQLLYAYFTYRIVYSEKAKANIMNEVERGVGVMGRIFIFFFFFFFFFFFGNLILFFFF